MFSVTPRFSIGLIDEILVNLIYFIFGLFNLNVSFNYIKSKGISFYSFNSPYLIC